MKLHELRSLTILEISRRIGAGSTSPSEIVRVLLSQIHRAEHKMKACVTVCEDSAVGLVEAAECDRGIVALK
jgi:Asp-tRNA(Asn)/Glu-tRNA(Gln) amidotransferase A subunit family amidase